MIIAWSCLLAEIVLIYLFEPAGSKRTYILTTYYLMAGISLIGSIQSFRMKTQRRYRVLNLFTFILIAAIIYSMHIGFLGALD